MRPRVHGQVGGVRAPKRHRVRATRASVGLQKASTRKLRNHITPHLKIGVGWPTGEQAGSGDDDAQGPKHVFVSASDTLNASHSRRERKTRAGRVCIEVLLLPPLTVKMGGVFGKHAHEPEE